jgi:hypothetical protein
VKPCGLVGFHPEDAGYNLLRNKGVSEEEIYESWNYKNKYRLQSSSVNFKSGMTNE